MADLTDGKPPAKPALFVVKRANAEERIARRMQRDAFSNEVRQFALRGLTRFEIAQRLACSLAEVNREYRRLQKDLRASLSVQAIEAQKSEAFARMALLREELWKDYGASKTETPTETIQEVLKDQEGKTRGSRVLVKKLPARPNHALAREIRETERLLLELLGLLGPATEVNVQVQNRVEQQNAVFVLTPSRPLDLEKLARLNAVIKARSNGGLPPAAA